MKRTNDILRGLLGMAVLIFFISCNKQTENKEVVAVGDSIPLRLPVAYISLDTLLSKYQFVIDRNEANLKLSEDKRLALNKRVEKLQKEALEFQQKLQQNVYYSQERAEQQRTLLMRQEQDIEKAAAEAEQELGVEHAKLQQALRDTFDLAIKEFNNGKYQIIFANANTSTFFYMDESYDITNEVLSFLNARYKPQKD